MNNSKIKIQIENTDYLVDLEKAINAGFLTKIEPKKYPTSIGQRIKNKDGKEWIIAEAGGVLHLVCLSTGRTSNSLVYTWTTPERNNVFNLTKESIDILTQFLDDWELIQPPVLRFVQYQYFTDEEKELARIARINGKLEYKNNPNFDWKRTEKSDFPNYQSYYRIVE